jgi:hypothetical protein
MSNPVAAAIRTRQREFTMILQLITFVLLSLLGLSCVVAPFVGTAR